MLKIRSRVMENSNGLMVDVIRGSGLMENSTVLEL